MKTSKVFMSTFASLFWLFLYAWVWIIGEILRRAFTLAVWTEYKLLSLSNACYMEGEKK